MPTLPSSQLSFGTRNIAVCFESVYGLGQSQKLRFPHHDVLSQQAY